MRLGAFDTLIIIKNGSVNLCIVWGRYVEKNGGNTKLQRENGSYPVIKPDE